MGHPGQTPFCSVERVQVMLVELGFARFGTSGGTSGHARRERPRPTWPAGVCVVGRGYGEPRTAGTGGPDGIGDKLGTGGLQGWREKVADGVAEPVARRVSLETEQVRALVGAAFFALAVLYVIKALTAATREARQS
jgi:hypothetical protein